MSLQRSILRVLRGYPIRVFLVAMVVLIGAWSYVPPWTDITPLTVVQVRLFQRVMQVHIDGVLWYTGRLPEDAPGRFGIGFPPYQNVGEFTANVQGLDYLVVRDLDSGEVRFEEGFQSEDASSPVITPVVGDWNSDDGVLKTRSGGLAFIGDATWTDGLFEFGIRGLDKASLLLRSGERVWSLDIHRHGKIALFLHGFANGESIFGEKLVEKYQYPWQLRGVFLAQLIFGCRMATILLGTALLVGLLVRWTLALLRPRREELPHLSALLAGWGMPLALGGLGLVAFAYLTELHWSYLGGIAHVVDENGYILTAKTFARGWLTAPMPVTPEHFEHPFILMRDGRWFSQYFWAYPAFLALGERVGAMWLVPILFGVGCVVLTGVLGWRLDGPFTGAVAAAHLLTAPMFLTNAASYMSHAATLFFVLVFILGFWESHRSPSISWRLATGAALGVVFNIRPVIAVGLSGAAVVAFLAMATRYRLQWRQYLRYAVMLAGFVPLAVSFFAYNDALTGDPLKTAYELRARPNRAQMIFNPEEKHLYEGEPVVINDAPKLSLFWVHFRSYLENASPVDHGLLGFLLFAVVLGRFSPGMLWMLVAWACLVGCYSRYPGVVLAYGPRYWFESLGPLSVLVGIAAGKVTSLVVDHRSDRAPGQMLVSGGIVITLLLTLNQNYFWQLDSPVRDDHPFPSFRGLSAVEGPIPDYHETPTPYHLIDHFFVDRSLHDAIEREDLRRSILFVRPRPNREGHSAWYGYNSVFARNEPAMDGECIVARYLGPAMALTLSEAYPWRSLWIVDWDGSGLEPYDPWRREVRWDNPLFPMEQRSLPNLSLGAPRSTD